MKNVPIISVTGTKGKTTTVAVIADVLQKLEKNVLKVDTTGHFVNGERRSTLEDSKNTWQLVPTVSPGRYLWEFLAHPELRENGVAVLECALGSSAISGLGYRYHNVGVFLNVFEDHMGSSDRIQSKEDIARAKEFVFSRLQAEQSYAVFNADDELVVDRLAVLPVKNEVVRVPFGLTFDHFNIQKHLNEGGVAITVNEAKQIVLRTRVNDTVMLELSKIPWTFDGVFIPSTWNLLAAVGAIYGYFDGVFPDGVKDIFESVRLDPDGGRLTLFENKEGVKILADYAHEKVSLELVGQLARTQVKPGNKVIGVVRLAHDRTDDLMTETGQAIAAAYDQFIVYEKIDGYWRQPSKKGKRFPQIIGRTSEIFANAIRSRNPDVERILREDEAIERAAQIAKPGDMVVIIVNDDIPRSIGFIQKSFKAELL
jgi:cyanophycin synthetase